VKGVAGAVAPAGPASAASAALSSAAASTEPAVMAAKSLRRASAGIFSSSRLISPASRFSSSLDTRASTAWPSRACGAPNSIEPSVQASVSIFASDGDSVGVRALPLLRRSSPRARSSARRERLTP